MTTGTSTPLLLFNTTINGILLQATLPECCPYPVNSSKEAEKPREELVGI